MEWKDPIVEEVRKIREELLEEHKGFDGFISYLKKMEKLHRKRIVKPKTDRNFQSHKISLS